jgi:hypothetical protein
VNRSSGRPRSGRSRAWREWRDLAERLAELDLKIVDPSTWATDPDDIAELARVTGLRNEMRAAVAQQRISRRLRQTLEAHAFETRLACCRDRSARLTIDQPHENRGGTRDQTKP